jgi:hypothetical protein
MPRSRRDFLKGAGAGLAGVAAGVPAAGGGEENLRPAGVRLRPLVVPGAHGYADRESVAAGEEIAFFISSTEPYRLSIARLGVAVDDPAGDLVLHEFPESPARPQPIHPGSYIHVEKGLGANEPLRALTLECWVRPWRIARRSGLLTQLDVPGACGLGLFLEAGGAVSFYLGDGARFREDILHATAAGAVRPRRWHHVAATWDGKEKAVWIDGKEAGRWAFSGPAAAGPSPLRLGAFAEEGRAAGFLDGDIAMPAIHARALDAAEVDRRRAAEGLVPAVGEEVEGCWSLAEERGDRAADASGRGRHGTIVNGGTWMIGGPSFRADVPRFGSYDPRADARRGHGLRLAADDLYDCGWEASHRYRLPASARPGYHVGRIRYRMAGQERIQHITFVVRAPRSRPRSPILLLAATNTWRAYSATPFAAPRPGIRHVAGTDGMENGAGDPPAFSFYRGHAGGQGTYQMGLRMPWPIAGPYIRYGDATDYSHLMRAERFFQVWLERSGHDFDMATDLDLHRDPDLLREHRVLVLNGHSEYWSRPMVEGVRRYLEGGGNVLCLSGNTMFWRVSFDEACTVLECRKVDAPGDQMPPERRGECWHSQDGARGGLLAECGLPGWELVGLTTLGWNNQGAPAHFSPFIVEDPDHFLFREPVPVGVARGDRIGEASGGGLPRANGHEVDVRVSTLKRLLVKPPPEGAVHPEDPPGIRLLAAGREWPRSAPKFDMFLRQVESDLPLGGEVIYWERPAGGRVFNAGSIGAGWALLADERFQRLVANVLHHFGVPRP